MNTEQPDECPQPLVVHVVFADLTGSAAYSYRDGTGKRIVSTGDAYRKNDPAARESTYRAVVDVLG